MGTGPYAGLVSQALLPETYHAVAQPSLATGLHGLDDVLGCTLLHDEYEPRIPEQVDWPRWRAAQRLRVSAERLRRGQRFSHTYLTLEAAAAGEGVAVVSDVLAGDAVAQGKLMYVPGSPVRGPYQYHLVHPQGSDARPQVSAFCDWLRQEARNFQHEAAA